jgi:hypothetical protein
MRPRFSILGLMAVILLVALGLAALKSPSELRASLVFTATVFVLLTATLGVLLDRSPALTGFALFGWASLLLAFGPMSLATTVPRPLSTLILEAVLPAMNLSPVSGFSEYHNVSASIGVNTGGTIVTAPVADLQIGHSLLSLLAALVGGVVARVFAARSEAAESVAREGGP